jgi:CheY-like chemotaxis protein
MVVEDDRDFTESITLILETSGYEVLSVEDGERFFTRLEHEKPDLILMDIMMKSLTEGFNILYEMKLNPEYRMIPVIIVSAINKHIGFPIDKAFLQVEEYLEKSLNPQKLLDSVKRLIGS